MQKRQSDHHSWRRRKAKVRSSLSPQERRIRRGVKPGQLPHIVEPVRMPPQAPFRVKPEPVGLASFETALGNAVRDPRLKPPSPKREPAPMPLVSIATAFEEATAKRASKAVRASGEKETLYQARELLDLGLPLKDVKRRLSVTPNGVTLARNLRGSREDSMRFVRNQLKRRDAVISDYTEWLKLTKKA